MQSEILLVLALLGGYLFIHLAHFFRYRAQSLNGTRLLFESATAGLPFLALARLLVAFPHWPAWSRDGWNAYAGFVPYSATIGAALVLATVSAVLMNVVVGLISSNDRESAPPKNVWDHLVSFWAASRRASLNRAIERYGNSLQKAQHFAATHADDGILIGVSLASRKIYAGFVVRSPDLTPNDGFVELLPAMSGYRGANDLVVHYDYLYPIFQPNDEENPQFAVPVVVPISEIQSLHILERTDLQSSLEQLLQREEPPAASVTEAGAAAGGAATSP